MPTLLSIHNYFYLRAGAENIFFAEMDMLGRNGWKVIPFSMKDEKNLDSEWSRFFINSLEFEHIKSLPAKIAAVPKIIYSIEARKKLELLLSEVKPEICHVHNIFHHLSPSILSVLKKKGIPTVMTLHDLKIACPAYTMFNQRGICERCKGGKNYQVLRNKCIKGSMLGSAVIMLESYLHRWLKSYRNNVDLFIVPSRFYLEKFVEWGWSEEQFVYVPNFVDTEQFRVNKAAGDYFLYFGRLSFEKGIATLIKAALKTNIKLKIAGTGPDMDNLKALSGDSEDIEFLGFLQGKRLHDAIGRARAVVVPSVWYENAPVSIMESYAMGRPVIGAAIGGIPELIKNQQTGFTFTSGDENALAEVLERVQNESDMRLIEMGMNGRKWMETDFNPANHLKMLKQVYQGIGVNL